MIMTRIRTTVVKWTARLEQLQLEDVSSLVVVAPLAVVVPPAAAVVVFELRRETLLCELVLDLVCFSALFSRLHSTSHRFICSFNQCLIKLSAIHLAALGPVIKYAHDAREIFSQQLFASCINN